MSMFWEEPSAQHPLGLLASPGRKCSAETAFSPKHEIWAFRFLDRRSWIATVRSCQQWTNRKTRTRRTHCVVRMPLAITGTASRNSDLLDSQMQEGLRMGPRPDKGRSRHGGREGDSRSLARGPLTNKERPQKKSEGKPAYFSIS